MPLEQLHATGAGPPSLNPRFGVERGLTAVLLAVWALGALVGPAHLDSGIRLSRRLGRRTVDDPVLVATLNSLRTEAGIRRPVRLTSSPLGSPVALGRSDLRPRR
jgi:hypothetical protein